MRSVSLLFALACTAARPTAADEPRYTIEQAAPAEVAVGAPAVARLALVPRAPYHTNREYPTRLRASAPPEVALAKPEQKLADAKSMSDARLEFEVPFSAQKPGAHAIDVELKSAVCTKETCVPLKEKLVWRVTAK